MSPTVASRTSGDRTDASRVLLGGVAALLVVALASGVLFLRQRNRADTALRTSAARELAHESTIALDEDPELSILLALHAVRSGGDSPLPDSGQRAARGCAEVATRVSRRGHWRTDRRQSRRSPPRHHLVRSKGCPGVGPGNGQAAASLAWPVQLCCRPRVQPRRATARGQLRRRRRTSEDEEVAAVVVWDATTGAELSRLSGPPGVYWSPAFSPDGRLVAAIGSGRLIEWDATSGAEAFSIEPPLGFGQVTFLPDGQELLVAEGSSEADCHLLRR